MAYKPKYLQKKGGLTAVAVVLTLVIVPLSLILTYLLMNGMYRNLARPRMATAFATTPNVAVAENFDSYVSGQLDDARTALLTGGSVEQPTVPEETEPVVRPVYTIADDVQVAPEPNQECFGSTDDPAAMAEIIEQAAFILEGQELYFSTDVELFAGSVINYYLDDSIFAITWKEVHDKSVYTFTEVKIAHPSQLRRHLSDGEYGSGKLYLPTEMATTVNAVVATSGDFYANRPIFGVVTYEGRVRRGVDDKYAESCHIDDQGNLIFSHMGELRGMDNAQVFVDENNINFSLAFGPILVENYEVRPMPSIYGVGEIAEEYARSALCQMDTLHYLVGIANNEGEHRGVPTVAAFQKIIAATGCKMAYCLDGGQTAAIVMNDQLINRPAKGEQRRISDIIYFATAVPEEG